VSNLIAALEQGACEIRENDESGTGVHHAAIIRELKDKLKEWGRVNYDHMAKFSEYETVEQDLMSYLDAEICKWLDTQEGLTDS
jgi:hypothetical protein